MRIAPVIVAGLLAGVAAAQEAAPPPPAPPPAAAEGGALLTTVNIDALKGVFDKAGVPVKVEQTSGGWPYLVATLHGYPVYALVVGCAGDDPKGACGYVSIQSSSTAAPLPQGIATTYNNELNLAHVISFDDGTGALRYVYSVKGGVGPDYMREAFIQFTNEMALLDKMITDAAAPAATPASGGAAGFSSSLPKTGLGVTRPGAFGSAVRFDGLTP